MKKYALIVAGGLGNRMNSDVPKQFIPVVGKPVLMHTILAFYIYGKSTQIIVVLPKYHISRWESLCREYEFTIPHQVVTGGKTRFHSVKNGLGHVSDNSLVAVHDGVRPLVSVETISRGFELARKQGNAVPTVPIYDSVRYLSGIGNHPINRTDLRLIQTPQCFNAYLLKKAYQQTYKEKFTDDATVVESLGETINLYEGNPENIKITRNIDLQVAEVLMSKDKLF